MGLTTAVATQRNTVTVGKQLQDLADSCAKAKVAHFSLQ